MKISNGMKTFNVKATGNVPSFILASFEPFKGKESNKRTRLVLDETVTEVVVDMELCHGNTSQDGASLWPRDNEKWNLEITIS